MVLIVLQNNYDKLPLETFNSVKINERTVVFGKDNEKDLLFIQLEKPIDNGTIFNIQLSYIAYMQKSDEEKSVILNGFYETSYFHDMYVL